MPLCDNMIMSSCCEVQNTIAYKQWKQKSSSVNLQHFFKVYVTLTEAEIDVSRQNLTSRQILRITSIPGL